MIVRISGTLLEKQPPFLLIDVQGLGYEVQAPMSTFYQLPEVGQNLVLHTHFVVREDAQLLYGFHSVRERSLFRTLIKVNGVGPKMAMAILSGIEADQFVRCVEEGNVTALVKVPGVGKKTAERLIVEVKDKLKEWQPQQGVVMNASELASDSDIIQDAEGALIALGYKPQDAAKAVSKVSAEGLSSEALIRAALKNML